MKKIFGFFFLTLILAAGAVFLFNPPTVGKALAKPSSNTVNGACGETVNSCTSGTLSDKNDSEHDYKWECKGSGEDHQDADCEKDKPTKVNCVGNWSNNSTCSVTCGGGVFQQIFNITTPASNGGTACTNNNGDTRWGTTSCNTNSCPVECPANSTPNSDKVCTCNSGYHQVNTGNEFTCAADPSTPTPTPTVPPAGHGDGLSDGRSSCPSCTQAPKSSQAVLGASTGSTKSVLGLSTTSGEETSALGFIQLFAALTSGMFGFKFLKK